MDNQLINIAEIEIPPDVLSLIPKKIAFEYTVLPIALKNGTLHVALANDYDLQAIQDISFFLGKIIEVEPVPNEILRYALERFYGKNGEILSSEEVTSPCENIQMGDLKNYSLSGDTSVVTYVGRIITEAIRLKASDIHIEPYEKKMRIRYRLDGVLHEVLEPSLEKSKLIISRLKILADLDIAEKRRPQDGRIRINEGDKIVDIRVSSLPTDFGEKIVLRILDKSQLKLDIAKLGFEADDLKLFQRIVKLPYGMVLVTGPTGSGKTTTLYAALNYINKPEINITTIEDPIEYNLAGINQTHVRSEIGLTFAAALRSILRQDPNVIMVGEIRDSETAQIAIRSALTGHLVFSTLHTNDAPSAITRLIDMGIEPFLVASSVKMILAQRLLRKLCDKCKYLESATPDQIEELRVPAVIQFYKSKGCTHCNHVGYDGRTAVYEILPINNGIGDLIVRGVSTSEVRTTAQAHGMFTLRQAGIKKAEHGITSLDEVIRETTS